MVAVLGVGVALPFTGVASLLGFDPLPASYFVFLVVVVAAYLGVVELVKARVFHRATQPA
jgi:Mg2+-importing ATPase